MGGSIFPSKMSLFGPVTLLGTRNLQDLYASVILEKSMNLTQLGVNHTAADTTDAINNAISVCSQNKIHLIIPAHTYNITSITSEDVSGYHYKYFLKSLSNIYITGENRDNSIIKVNTNENYTGVFFNEEDIDSWAADHPEVRRRAEQLNQNYARSMFGEKHPRKISAKYLLLHTLSHLLIKQLSFECGYGIASLKERIYSGETTDGKQMAGILIYTAGGDSEGTLGGLVRQGRHDIFPGIFRKAIETARICSGDPVCSLSNGQGRIR